MPRKKKVEEVSEIKLGDIIKTKNEIALRLYKDITAPVCQRLKKGSEIEIIGVSVDWYLVKYNTVYAYMPKTYLYI